MNQITKLAEQRNLKVIEDCAQAHGAEYNGNVLVASGILAHSVFSRERTLARMGMVEL